MDHNSFETYLLKVAGATFANGGTASRVAERRLLPAMDVWQFPRYPARTIILPPDTDLVTALRSFIRTNEAFLSEPDCWLGTWIHPQTRCFYLDITSGCEDLEEARRLARETGRREGRKIVALYNSGRKETVYL